MRYVLSFVFFSISLSSYGQMGHYGHNGIALLPDAKVTPGAIRTTDESGICAKTFRTGPYRKTTEATKIAVCKEYAVKNCPHLGFLEIDHLVPLELGGLDDIKDLWPQPAKPLPGYHQKDVLEDYLKRAVCVTKSISLADAQGCIMHDWVACSKRFGLLK